MKPYGRIKVQENEDGRQMLGSGCKTCPVTACATMTYRGSACASQRESYGLDDPMTNADHIRSMSDEELAKEMSSHAFALATCSEKAWLEWLKQPYKEEKE